MSSLYGFLGLPDSDRSYVQTVGQQMVYSAAQQLLARYNAELNAAMSLFVERTTSDFKFRYKLPGGGRMQRSNRFTRPGAVKITGAWDVALPLEDFRDAIIEDDISMAYMTLDQMNLYIQNILIRDTNTVRFEMLKALFNSNQDTFVDEVNGSLTIEPLANGDSVVYPPVIGSESEATENHYLESGYAATAISDTNDPYATIRAELEEHFGYEQGGSNILVLINSAETPETKDLTDFDPVNDRFTQPGADTDTLFGIPSVPGRIIGRVSGVWVSEWPWMPANYMVGIHLDAPKPLLQRVDPAETRLGMGLQLVAREQEFPLETSIWRHRYGFGVGNRLNGVVMELGTGGSYTIPTAYQ